MYFRETKLQLQTINRLGVQNRDSQIGAYSKNKEYFVKVF